MAQFQHNTQAQAMTRLTERLGIGPKPLSLGDLISFRRKLRLAISSKSAKLACSR
jgi:hypothetical protein